MDWRKVMQNYFWLIYMGLPAVVIFDEMGSLLIGYLLLGGGVGLAATASYLGRHGRGQFQFNLICAAICLAAGSIFARPSWDRLTNSESGPSVMLVLAGSLLPLIVLALARPKSVSF